MTHEELSARVRLLERCVRELQHRELQQRELQRRAPRSPASRRRWRRFSIAAGVAVGIAFPVTAFTYDSVPQPVEPGTVVSASKMNQNLQHLVDGITGVESRLDALESLPKTVYVNPTTGKQYSTAGSFCGFSAPTTGNLGGYVGAKDLCESVSGCSASSHLCSVEQARRFVATGGNLPSLGWVSAQRTSLNDWNNEISDCESWTSDTGLGLVMAQDGGTLERGCNQTESVFCCD